VGFLLLGITAWIPATRSSGAEPPQAAPKPDIVVDVRLDPEIHSEPVTGRLYVFFSTRQGGEPMRGPNWFAPEPFFGRYVVDLKPGATVRVDDSADGFPNRLSKLPHGTYRVQTLLDRGFYQQNHAREPGNFYSDVATLDWKGQRATLISLDLNKTIDDVPFPRHPRVHEIVRRSPLLSAFHEREVLEYATVVLPEGYDEQPRRRYPVVYVIPGFSGSHRDAPRYVPRYDQRTDPPESDDQPSPEERPAAKGDAQRLAADEVEFIYVMLSGQCKWGHHVYADSATNGPRGTALVEEMIPFIDEHFRTIAEPTARFVTGHSSGGWASLWLQVTYPEVFGGVWSTAPDPIDFRDYQQVDLYADPPRSLYVDEQGQRRPLARRGEQPVLWYDDFARMDDVLGRGGQLRSFEAVFSPLDKNGLPKQLWDRQTGRIDPEVASAWEKYDIGLTLHNNWDVLEDQLQGKLHVAIGSLDTFYLEGAVALFADTVRKLGSDAEVVIVPGRDHGSLLSREFMAKMRQQMAETFLENHGARDAKVKADSAP
jgi:pimeloyl-ACP methyl ester carboxylesterase